MFNQKEAGRAVGGRRTATSTLSSLEKDVDNKLKMSTKVKD